MTDPILFIHFRTGERDGVSLEIEKKAQLLEKKGYTIHFLTGYDPRASEKKDNIKVIKQLDIKRRLSGVLRETFFQEKILDNSLAWLIYHSEEEKIYAQVLKFLRNLKPKLVFIHNVFSTSYHLPATTGIMKALEHYFVPVICTHHDFWWEREMFTNPKYQFISELLSRLPSNKSYILKHQVINSLAQEKLFEKSGIQAEKIGDYFDFDKPLPQIDDFNQDFLTKWNIGKDDLVILHATRIVERKAIENAIMFAKVLEEKIRKKAPFLIKGKTIRKNSKVHLILPNFIEVDSEIYFKKLKALAEELQVSFIWCGDRVALERRQENQLKIYSFWDVYRFADCITYTSLKEGFGNQLLEAFWAKKIPVIFEYPVFKKDIKSEGYKVVSLGDVMKRRNGFSFVPREMLEKGAEELLSILSSDQIHNQVVEKNFAQARIHHDLSLLSQDLDKTLLLLRS